MRSSYKVFVVCAALALATTACEKKLDLFPTNDVTAESVYSTPLGYKQVLAKVYAGLALTGNTGPAGSSDIQGLDEGSQSPFIRGIFNAQDLTTDMAVVSWNDQTIHDFHYLRWTASDVFLKGMYARPIYNVSLANEYLRESTDEKLAARNITGTDAEEIKRSRAEVRFLRAYNYWVMMDLFGRSTFITEDDAVGTALPREITRPELFSYIEGELLAIEADLLPAKTAEYSRVDNAAAWALLSRMYLNAEVYTGTAKWTEAIANAKKVIAAGYSLQPSYPALFMADNHKQADEFIFVVNCDGLYTKSYGNTTFFAHAAAGSNNSNEYGISDGWSGYRTTSVIPELFGNGDQRALFTNLDNKVINSITEFSQGAHVKKWVNIRTDGQPVSDPTRTFADMDFPIFRLPEMYLTVAEAFLRGGSGTTADEALGYFNAVRYRAYGNTNAGIIATPDFTLQTVLNERGREFYWEAQRRTDLIRYNQFTTANYLWPWKGGVQQGTAVDSKYNLFPIPTSNITSNPNLHQNPGY